jgi:hypothetical protein
MSQNRACPFCGSTAESWSTEGGSGFKKWVSTWVECTNIECKCRAGFVSRGYRQDSQADTFESVRLQLFELSEQRWNSRKAPKKSGAK